MNHSRNLAIRTFALWACFCWALACGGGLPARAADGPARAEADARTGQVIRITLPLDDNVVKRVRRSVHQVLARAQQASARPVLIFEFDVARNGPEAGHGTPFGYAYDLATFLSGEELNAATTVAYLPQSIEGHAVLVALACDQIIMGEKATIGKAGVDEKVVDETQLSAYREIAGRRHTLPVELAVGMLRPAQDVLKVQTEASTEYVTASGLEELRQRHTIQSQETIIRKGEPGWFSGAELRRLGFVKRLAANRLEVVRALGLPTSAVEQDPSQGEPWRAVRVDLKGPINPEKIEQAIRLIQDEIRLHNVNFVCLWIDSPGGPPIDAKRLADFLAFDLDPSTVRTVAYIPEQARDTAALVALACDQIVMHPGAVLGGPGAYQMSENNIKSISPAVQELATKKMRSWSLWQAMIDPQLDVYACTRLGDVEYFCDEELATQQPQPGEGGNSPRWQKGALVTRPGVAFRTGGAQALDYRLANHTVDNLADFRRLYDLENDPTLVEPGWADILVDALRSPGITALLLLIGGVALYLELHSPGIGIGGFIAAVCFVLFFWSHYLGGTAGWLEIVLFLAGIACLHIGGFRAARFRRLRHRRRRAGAGFPDPGQPDLRIAAQRISVPAVGKHPAEHRRSRRRADRRLRRASPLAAAAPAYQHVMLEPPEGEEAQTISRREKLTDLENLIGTTGVTTTQLTPAGKARFGSTLVDVISDGDFIPRNTPVVVAEVHGNRVLVKSAE